MILKKIEIEQFGGLKNFELELSAGPSYLFGENEAGKSTLCGFLAAMFYGMEKMRGGGLRHDGRKLYMPWGESYMAGTIRFSHQGEDYMIKRRFGETARGDRCQVYAGTEWEPVSISPDEIGPRFLGVGQDAFRKTLFISQLGALVEKGKEDELMTRLSNLEQTGDEDISVLGGVSELERASHELLSKTGRGGAIPQLEAEIQALEEELSDIHNRHESYRQVLGEIRSLTEERQIAEDRLRTLRRRRKEAASFAEYEARCSLRHKRTSLLEACRSREQALQETEEKIQILQEEIEGFPFQSAEGREMLLTLTRLEADISITEERLKEGQALLRELALLEEEQRQAPDSKSGIFMFSLSAFLLLVAIILCIFVTPYLGFSGLLALLPFGLGLKNQREKHSRQEERMARIGAKKEQLSFLSPWETERVLKEKQESYQGLLQENGAESLSDLSEKLESLETSLHRIELLRQEKENQKQELLQHQASLSELPEQEEEPLMVYNGPDEKTLTEALELQTEQHTDLERQLARLTAMAESGFSDLRSASVVESELERYREKKSELEKTHEALQLAKDILTACSEELKQSFAPILNQKLSRYIDKLTEGRYYEARMTDDYRLRLAAKSETGLVESDYVSAGTCDLIYFALRLSVLETLMPEIPLLILDDTFVQLDKKRRTAAFSLLRSCGAEQILYVSCHERPREADTFSYIQIKKTEK